MNKRTIELDEGQIAIIWSLDDVLMECKWLTKEQGLDVLHGLDDNHDAAIGINWEVIRDTAHWKYPEPEEQEDE
jgi:hypothetical protein